MSIKYSLYMAIICNILIKLIRYTPLIIQSSFHQEYLKMISGDEIPTQRQAMALLYHKIPVLEDDQPAPTGAMPGLRVRNLRPISANL